MEAIVAVILILAAAPTILAAAFFSVVMWVVLLYGAFHAVVRKLQRRTWSPRSGDPPYLQPTSEPQSDTSSGS